MDADTIDTLLAFVLVPAVIVIALSLLAWLPFRRRVHWHRWEFAVPTVIVLVSMLLFPLLPVSRWRGLSNYAIELVGACAIAVLVPWFRVLFPGRTAQASLQLAVASFVIALILALLLWVAMPPLGE